MCVALFAVAFVGNEYVFIAVTDTLYLVLNLLDGSLSECNEEDFFQIETFQPVLTESIFYNIKPSKGEIPEECNGVVFRIGPNPKFKGAGIKRHWIDGRFCLHKLFVNIKYASILFI